MTADYSQTNRARACLSSLQEQVDRGFLHLNKLCTVAGNFQSSELDAHQKVSYELAFCVAEIQASKAMLDYSDKFSSQDKLCEGLSLTFTADVLTTVWQRLFNHSIEAGLLKNDLISLLNSEEFDDFITKNGGVDQFSEIGNKINEWGNLNIRPHLMLPSGLDEEKDMVRDSFASFTDKVVMPLAEQIHRKDEDVPDEIIKAAADMGCFGTCIPEKFGGLMPNDKNDSLGMLVVTEELSRGSLGAAGSLITRPEIAARALLEGGTEEQKSLWLPRLATGEYLAAISITEPDYGSDVASLSLKASKTEGGWLLNGSKTWCTFAGKADVIVTIARTHPDKEKGHRGLSMFLVEKPRFEGHEFNYQNPVSGSIKGKAIPTIGYRGMHSYDLYFEDYFVPENALVGEEKGENRGFYLTMAGLSGGRIQTAARASGVMQAAIDKSVDYAKNRKVFGETVASFQLTKVKLGKMFLSLTASRQLSYSVARLMDNGEGQMEASLSKLFSCRAAEWVTREALQIHGGMGYAEESSVSRYFVDARVLSIFEGAEETLALKIIARGLIEKANKGNSSS